VGDTDTDRTLWGSAALGRIRLGVLGVLAASALIVALGEGGAEAGPTDRRFTLAALTLGMASILARHQAGLSSDPHLRAALAGLGLLLAGSIGLLGLWLAVSHGERDAGLLYALGGAILALRAPLAPAAPRPPSRGGP
jgi:hypothetical protein